MLSKQLKYQMTGESRNSNYWKINMKSLKLFLVNI